MKKIIFSLIILFIFVPIVLASSNTEASVDGKYYDSLEDAIANANDGDTIKLFSNVELDKGLIIDKNVEINLNGNNIVAPTAVFEIRKGYLTLSGEGTIKELEPNYGALRLIGNNEPTNDKYSSVYVGKNVTLEGWAGIFISHVNGKSYGVNAYLEGSINAVNDISGGTGIGVYVNGNIKDSTDSPNVNIMDGAVINSTGDGLYIAGTSKFNVGKATISGVEAGIGIKAGSLIIDGATVLSNGKDYTPTEGYSNGIKASGTAIQIESNSGYAGNIMLDIKNGTFKSKNSYVIYEYIGKGSNTTVKSININDGTFISGTNKDTLIFSPSFNKLHKGFISGGEYSTDPSIYLSAGYSSNFENDLYTVTKNTIKDVFSNSGSNGSKSYSFLILLIFLFIVGLILYYNRKNIVKIIKK